MNSTAKRSWLLKWEPPTFAPLPAFVKINRPEHNRVSAKLDAKLEEDNRLIVHAAANAQRAVDFIMGTTFEDQAESDEESEEEAVVGASFDSYSSAA